VRFGMEVRSSELLIWGDSFGVQAIEILRYLREFQYSRLAGSPQKNRGISRFSPCAVQL